MRQIIIREPAEGIVSNGKIYKNGAWYVLSAPEPLKQPREWKVRIDGTGQISSVFDKSVRGRDIIVRAV